MNAVQNLFVRLNAVHDQYLKYYLRRLAMRSPATFLDCQNEGVRYGVATYYWKADGLPREDDENAGYSRSLELHSDLAVRRSKGGALKWRIGNLSATFSYSIRSCDDEPALVGRLRFPDVSIGQKALRPNGTLFAYPVQDTRLWLRFGTYRPNGLRVRGGNSNPIVITLSARYTVDNALLPNEGLERLSPDKAALHELLPSLEGLMSPVRK